MSSIDMAAQTSVDVQVLIEAIINRDKTIGDRDRIIKKLGQQLAKRQPTKCCETVVKGLENDVEAKEKAIEDLEEALGQKQTEVDSSVAKNESYVSQLIQERKRNEFLHETLKKERREFEELRQALLEAQASEVREKKHADEKIASLEARNEELASDNREKTSIIDGLEQKIRDLEATGEEKTQSINHMTADAEKATLMERDNRALLADYMEALAFSNQRESELIRKINGYEKENERLEERVQAFEEKTWQAQDNGIEELCEKWALLRQENKESMTWLSNALKGYEEVIVEQLATTQSEKERLEQENESLTKEMGKLKGSISHIEYIYYKMAPLNDFGLKLIEYELSKMFRGASWEELVESHSKSTLN